MTDTGEVRIVRHLRSVISSSDADSVAIYVADPRATGEEWDDGCVVIRQGGDMVVMTQDMWKQLVAAADDAIDMWREGRDR